MFKNQKHIQNVYIQVTINPETGEKKDIINFYNEIYIKTMKEYIISSKQDGSKTPIINGASSLTPNINKP